jgi:hypothetical protein
MKRQTADAKKMDALEANFLRRISPILSEAQELVTKEPLRAKAILKEIKFNERIKTEIIESSMLGVVVGRGGDMNEVTWDGVIISSPVIKDVPKMREFVLKTTIDKSKSPLIKTLKNTDFSETVVTSVRDQIISSKDWVSVSRGVRDSVLKDNGQLPQHLKNVLDLGRKQNLTLDQKKELSKVIREAKIQIEKLNNTGAQTQYLKKSYERVVKAVEEGSQEAIKKATESAIKNKTRYEAERIVRTESQAMYDQASVDEALQNDLITGLEFVLSSGHKPDECDFYAEADLFGLGRGIWAKEHFPYLPIHPNGRSSSVPFAGKQAEPINEKKAIQYLKKSPAKEKILGVGGASAFKKNPDQWKDLLGFSLSERRILTPQ